MSQLTFAEAEFEHKKRKTRRELFLERMDALIPWKRLEKKIARYYAKAGSAGGRPAYPLPTMLRVHCMQLFYNLSDPAMEEALYEIASMRKFADLHLDRIPDETTILNFRHLLERHGLGKTIFKEINAHLKEQGLQLKEGTIVDATIIAAPSSTKNKAGERDPEMHQTRKGQQWYFGMKAHVGVDAASGLVHTVVATAGNVADVTLAAELLHGEEEVAYGDSGYTGAPRYATAAGKPVEWQIAARRSTIGKLLPGSAYRVALEALEKAKARMRAKVEHVFHVVKNLFRHRKARYRGLGKNGAQLFTLFGLANLVLARRLVAAHGRGAP